jgi:hypothetical protein
MDTEDLRNLFLNVHGNVTPIIDEIVYEYSNSFDISFKLFDEYTQRQDDVLIRFQIPSRDKWINGTFNETKIIQDWDKQCFKFIRTQGDYRLGLFVPFGNDLTVWSWMFVIEKRCISLFDDWKIILQETTHRINDFRNIQVVTIGFLEIYSIEMPYSAKLLTNTYLAKFIKTFRN